MHKSPYSHQIEEVVSAIFHGHDLSAYDCKKLRGYPLYRVRVGTVRIVFGYDNEGDPYIVAIGSRGDIYKSF